jgi:hypothetical protein
VDATEHARSVARDTVKLVEVIAENVDDDGRRIAGQAFLNALRQERRDGEVHARESRQRLAHVGLRPFGLSAGQPGLQTDLELAVVRAPGVVGRLGPTDALRDRAHDR